MKEICDKGWEVDYEYFEVKLNDNDVAKLEFIQDGKKDFINLIGRGEIFVKRRRWE